MNKYTSNSLLLRKISLLPEELVRVIYDFIPNQVLLWTCREKYYQHHSLVKGLLTLNYDTYIRNVLRNDFHVLFEAIMREDFENWVNNTKYKYGMFVYTNQYTFLLDFSRENSSTKCSDLLMTRLLDNFPAVNKHDKNKFKKKTKNIGW
jgi:hypothetical protein